MAEQTRSDAGERRVILRLLELPFRFVGFVVSLVLVLAVVEALGLSLYLRWAGEPALETLLAGGVSLTEVVAFLTASRERLLVAGGLAVASLLLVLTGGSGGGVGHTDADDGFGGGGFGDGRDGGGGGGGGDE